MPGVTFDKKSAARIADVVRTVEGASAQQGGDRYPHRQTRHVETVFLNNAEGTACPQYGVLWLDGFDESNNRYTAKQVDYAGITQIAIACGEIDASDNGLAWREGIRKVLCSDYASVAVQSRVGAQPDSWYAVAAKMGPMMVVGEVAAGDQPTGLPAGVGVVLAKLEGVRRA